MSQNTNGNGGLDLDVPVSTLSPGQGASNDLCETNGRRANRHRVFSLELGSDDLYSLLELLRKVALDSPVYQTVARAVTFERLLYQQAREQGF